MNRWIDKGALKEERQALLSVGTIIGGNVALPDETCVVPLGYHGLHKKTRVMQRERGNHLVYLNTVASRNSIMDVYTGEMLGTQVNLGN